MVHVRISPSAEGEMNRYYRYALLASSIASVFFLGVTTGRIAATWSEDSFWGRLAGPLVRLAGPMPDRVIIDRPPFLPFRRILGPSDDIRPINPALVDKAMDECKVSLRDALIERAKMRQRMDPKPLEVEIRPMGELVYRVTLRGNSVFLSKGSAEYWEDLSFYVFIARHYKDVDQIVLTVHATRSLKNKWPNDSPPNPRNWVEMGAEEMGDLTELQSVLASRFRACVLKEGT
jgi:hypothetical protein